MLSALMSEAYSVARENIKIFDDEASKFFTDKEIDRKMAEVDKRIGEALLDISLKIRDKTKENVFSESRQELISGSSPFPFSQR